MKIKGLFWILTLFLLVILGIVTWYVFYNGSFYLFLAVELLILATAIYLIYFYRSIIKPLRIIGDGMELLKEQDFSSRLHRVGQYDADRIVDVFNKMMGQLKNERIHVREQNHFLDLLIEASPMGVIILDLDQRIHSINPAGRAMFGMNEDDLSGEKSLAGIDSPLAFELMKINEYGSKTIRLSDANIYKCTYSSFIDKGFHHPFFLVESLTEEFFKAEKKAYEKVIRMIAHEVNNTTAGITSALDTIEEAFRKMAGADDIAEVLHVVIERCYGMSRFITNFADVVRIPEPQPGRQNLNTLVNSCLRFMENTCRNRNIRIRKDFAEHPPVVFIDSILFEQVILNIIKNSAEAIGENGEIVIKTTDNPVALEIIDSGKGIDKETESKLFTPFFSTKPNGQGIGLIFIREVLQKHNLNFSLRTHADNLTHFRILF